jgi:sigma-B regulation protein RsbQ
MDIIKRNNVKIIGEGKQTLLFAHGFGCDQNVWRYLVNRFMTEYKCILFDYVGAGSSETSAYNTEKYSTLDGYAQDVLDVCDALQLEKPIFIGHSVSSMIGVRAALHKPNLFSKLIFVTASPSYINEDSYQGGMERKDIEDLLSLMDSNYLGWSSMMAPLVMGNPERPELAEELNGNFCSTDPRIAREFARVTFLSDSRDDLKKLTVPTLTIQCSDDMLVPSSIIKYIDEKVKRNTSILLDATGHCPHLSAPDKTIEAIESYLAIPEMSIHGH